MRQVVIVMVVAFACALSGALVASADTPVEPSPTTSATETTQAPTLSSPDVQRAIDRYRRITWHWQRVMERPLTLTLADPPKDPLLRIQTWKQIATRTRAIAFHPPHLSAWSCIHRYEGAWTDT